MCTDTDMATDPGTDTFILSGPCSDLCRTVQVNGWGCLSLASLLVPFLPVFFLPVEKHVWSSHAIDHQNDEGRNRAAHSSGQRKCCYRRPECWWLQHFSFPWTHVQQNTFHWAAAINDAGEKGGKSTAFYMHNATKNVLSFVFRYVPIVCTHKVFALRHNACHIRIRTNGLAPLHQFQANRKLELG